MQDSFAYCETLVRAADKDRFLAALFAPAAQRGALHALYAFNVEIARVREVIHEPLAGEIRLQWWSDAIAGSAAGTEANPVAVALNATVRSHGLPLEILSGLIEARRFDLYDDPMHTAAQFDDYTRATSSALIALSARILEPGDLSGLAKVALHAGQAYAIAGLLQALPVHAARGQLFLPLDILARHGVEQQDLAERRATAGLGAALAELRERAREHLRQAGRSGGELPQSTLPAMLPAALVRPVLDRMESKDYDPFRPTNVAQWRRQWLLWRAARRPARIFS